MITEKTYEDILYNNLSSFRAGYCLKFINWKNSAFYKLPNNPTLADALNFGIDWNKLTDKEAEDINNIYLNSKT